MSARAIGSASISFGLVSLPVKMYSVADSTAAVRFNWIHKDCGSRLKQKYVCAQEGVEVERDDMVKGYEFAKNQYVLFSPEELKALEAKSDSAIDIVEFVPEEQVEPVYMEKSYYLGPGEGGDRAYRLLGRAMRETGLSALGRYNARGKQYLVLLSPMDDGIIMHQLHYADELRSFGEVPLPGGEVKEDELKLAVQLIEQIRTDEFQPDRYEDEVRKRVLDLIEKKIAGEDITEAPAEAPQKQIIDLMQALKASLGDEKARKPAKSASRKKTGGRKQKAAGS